MSVSVYYGNVAVGAKENFNVQDYEWNVYWENECDKTQIQKNRYVLKNYANPCELYQTVLDGTMSILPDDLAEGDVGLWSSTVSGSDGTFDNDIWLVVKSTSGTFSFPGLTFTYDTFNNIHSTVFTVRTYNGSTSLKYMKCTLGKKSRWFIQGLGSDNCNQINMIFSSINMPYNRLKVFGLEYGYGSIIESDEITSATMTEEVNLTSESLASTQCEVSFHLKTTELRDFTERQPMTVYYNDTNMLNGYIGDAKQTGALDWKVTIIDSIYYLDNFVADYMEAPTMSTTVSLIEDKGVSVTISDDNIASLTSEGYVDAGTYRDLLQQMCFAANGVNDSCVIATGKDEIIVKNLDETVTQAVEKDRVRQALSVKTESIVTEVQLQYVWFASYPYSTTISDWTKDEALYFYKNATKTSFETKGLTAGTYTYTADGYIGMWAFVASAPDTYSKGSMWQDSNNNSSGIASTLTSKLYGEALGKTIRITATEDITVSYPLYVYVSSGTGGDAHTATVNKKTETLSYGVVDNIITISEQTACGATAAEDILNNVYDIYSKPHTGTISIEEKTRHPVYGKAIYNTSKYGASAADVPIELGDTITVDGGYLGEVTGIVQGISYNLNGNVLVKECELVW